MTSKSKSVANHEPSLTCKSLYSFPRKAKIKSSRSHIVPPWQSSERANSRHPTPNSYTFANGKSNDGQVNTDADLAL
jgi:hypothetical protein